MMRITFYFLLILTIFPTTVFSQAPHNKLPDYYGEHIEYNLKAGPFTVGKVDIAFRGDSSGCGSYIICNAKSTGVVKFLKEVHYRFDACVDTSIGHTVKSTRYILEGSYTDYDEVYYDRTSRSDSTIAITEDNDSIVIPHGTYDILYAFFQFRKNYINSKMQIDSVTHINSFFVDDEWDLNIKYAGKEKIETDLGTATCYKFLPETEPGRYFKTNEDMTLYVTANRHRIPVLIEVKLKVATLTAEISSYKKKD